MIVERKWYRNSRKKFICEGNVRLAEGVLFDSSRGVFINIELGKDPTDERRRYVLTLTDAEAIDLKMVLATAIAKAEGLRAKNRENNITAP